MQQQLNAAELTHADTANLLSRASGRTVTPEMIQSAIDSGAPTEDGAINILHFAAWLSKELQRGA